MAVGDSQTVGLVRVRRWALAGTVALLGAAVALRFADLTGPSLWFDEGGSLRTTDPAGFAHMLSGLANTNHGDRFQPLYFIGLWCWRQLFGDGVFSVRLPSVLFGIAAVIVLWLGARRLWGDRGALWSLVFVVPSALLLQHAQEARPYAMLIFLSSLQTVLLLGLTGETHDSRAGRSWAFWIVTGVAGFASILTMLYSAGLAAGDLVAGRDWRVWLRRWVPAAIASVPALVFFLSSRVSSAPSDAQVTKLGGSVLRNAVFAVYGTLVGTSYGPPIQRLQASGGVSTLLDYWPALTVFALVAVALVVAGVVALRRGRPTATQRHQTTVLAVALAVSYVLMVGFTVVTRLNWQPRHSFFLVVPVALLVPLPVMAWGAGGDDTVRAAARRWRPAAAALLVALAALNVYSLAHYYADPAYARDDYRAAARYISSASGPGRPAVLLNGVIQLLQYYGAGSVVNGVGADQTALPARVAALTGDAGSVVLVVNRQSSWWKQPESIAAAMSPDYRLVRTVDFPYFSIYTFDRPGAGGGPGS